jgi:hypothetical protein
MTSLDTIVDLILRYCTDRLIRLGGVVNLMTPSEAKFKINVKEGIVEMEGTCAFVERHLEKFEEICKSAIQEAMLRQIGTLRDYRRETDIALQQRQSSAPVSLHSVKTNNRHMARQHIVISPVPVDLKAGRDKVGLREFYKQKRPSNHYEKTVVFVYYLTKFNKQPEVKFGEILSCYDEVDEKKPSIIDIVKNSIRYKGWLGQGSDRFSTILTISGENFVGFDLPQEREKVQTVIQAYE